MGSDGVPQQQQTADTLAATGPLTAPTIVVAGMLRQSGTVVARFENMNSAALTGASGVGVELFATSDSAWVQAYDRTNSAFTPLKLRASGVVVSNGLSTTAAAANVTIDSSGNLLQSSSSLAYKTDVETLDPTVAERVIEQARPIWYRSTADADRADWSWYGFAAEELAAIDPRLVHWGFQSDQYEAFEISPAQPATDDTPATPAVTGQRVRAGEALRPDGVQYERFVVIHQLALQRQAATIVTLLARIEALEAKLN